MKKTSWAAHTLAAVAQDSLETLGQDAGLDERKDYRRLDKPHPTETGKKEEVI